MDHEYVVTRGASRKGNVYNYEMIFFELVFEARAIQDNKNLIEWSQLYISLESRLHELVDPRLDDSFDYNQLQTVMSIVRWCTHNEGRARPCIKQVLRLLYEISDPLHDGFVEAVLYEEDEGDSRFKKKLFYGFWFSSCNLKDKVAVETRGVVSRYSACAVCRMPAR
ncbi:hypothetical protein Nepgr_012566 [Nepenthes gracilis]|uniref:Uncharacterized protein n=1 Tax=Nepenthes gracilis TaxID=150966 RepID=A0AAD3XNG5_NEPGR|nr:hypothetical protein Nepgr_012566 [Nepenthes gracilis]